MRTDHTTDVSMTHKPEPLHPDQDCVGDLPPLPSFKIKRLNEAIHRWGFKPPLQVGERWKARKENRDG